MKVPIPVTYRHSAQNGTLHKRLSDLFPKVLVTPGGQEKKKKAFIIIPTELQNCELSMYISVSDINRTSSLFTW